METFGWRPLLGWPGVCSHKLPESGLLALPRSRSGPVELAAGQGEGAIECGT